MRKYLQDLCEGIDAAVFSGDVLFSDEERKELKEYVVRWETAIVEHEAAEAAQQVVRAREVFAPVMALLARLRPDDDSDDYQQWALLMEQGNNFIQKGGSK